MGKYIVIENQRNNFESILFDNGIPLKFNLLWVLGDFLNIRKISEGRIEYNYKSHIFTVVDAQTTENNEMLQKEVNEAFLVLDEYIKMVHQNKTNLLEGLAYIREHYKLQFTYQIVLLTGEETSYTNPSVKQAKMILDKDYRVSYQCYSIMDMVCAVLHFYLLNNFHFIKCFHCGNYYATNTLKRQYCNRISPYIDK